MTAISFYVKPEPIALDLLWERSNHRRKSMTVSNNYAPVSTAANGVTTVFTASWNALSAANVLVQLLNTTTGVYSPVSQGVGANQYQVTTLTPTSLVITFNTAPASGNNVIISRNTAQTQTIPYTTSRGFQGSVEEGSFDALTNMVQELSDQVANSIQASVGDTTENLILPIATLRAGQYLGFDSSGNVITIAGAASTVNISTAMLPVVSASSTASALSLLGGVNAAALVTSQTGGFINKFRNPSMDIWQRGTSLTATNGTRAYMADGWQVLATGANAAVTQANEVSYGSYYSMKITGNTGMTDTYIATRIESYLAAQLLASSAGGTPNCTVQFLIYNNTGASLTPKLSIQHATSQDNWSGVGTDVNGVNLQTITNSSTTLCAYTWTPSGLSVNGLQFYLDFGAALNANTNSVALVYADVRSTPGSLLALTIRRHRRSFVLLRQNYHSANAIFVQATATV